MGRIETQTQEMHFSAPVYSPWLGPEARFILNMQGLDTKVPRTIASTSLICPSPTVRDRTL